MDAEFVAFLKKILTKKRLELFESVMENRTQHFCVGLEDIYQPHNASAVIRTCDCFGIQNVHVIETTNPYEINTEVTRGSAKWVNINRYGEGLEDKSAACVANLREKGYKIVATSPHIDGYTPDTIPIEEPLAIMMGNEGHGLSRYMLEEADMHLQVPMYGFTESFNLSVTAAMILQNLSERLRKSEIDWKLSEKERTEAYLLWFKNGFRNYKGLEAEFLSRHK